MYPDTPATENAGRHTIKLTKRHLVRLFWVLAVPFLFPSALAAEPSLAETVQYIEAKLTAYNDFWTNNVKLFILNGRTVTCIKERGEELTFKLSDLSTSIRVREAAIGPAIHVSCARRACVSHTDDGGTEIKGGIELPVSPPDVERVQKALSHAIKISGGKDELF